jgi:hypothetical protein
MSISAFATVEGLMTREEAIQRYHSKDPLTPGNGPS